MEDELYSDVTVIGAGWSGLLAVKYMLEEGLSVRALEKRDSLGGVWYYSDDRSINTVMKSTVASSSTTVTEMSDFPMPKEIGPFPHHTDILQYLHSYADNFHLKQHIQFNIHVASVIKQNNLWHTKSRDGRVYVSKFVVVSSGHCQPNRELATTLFSDFDGPVYHAAEIKEPLKEHKGARLLIVGGGETGSDLCVEWHTHTSLIHWSIPRGQHFFRKYTKILPWRSPQVLDKVSSRLITTIAPYHYSKPGLSWICKWTSNGSLLAYQGHGLLEWRNDSPFFRYYVNKNGKVLDLIDYKKVHPKGAIKSCSGNVVYFSDGSEQEFDVIILSTGYTPVFPFLPKQHSEKSFRLRYKSVFDNDDPSLAFVGFVRPVVGSIPAVSEVQARWVAKIFKNNIHFPLKEQRLLQTRKDAAFWNDYFRQSASDRLDGLVEGYLYIDDVAKLAGIYPDYYALFKRNTHHWYTSVVSPFNSSMYRLNEPKHREKAIANIESHRANTITPLHLLLILFLRIIWFDWMLAQLEKLKYRMQTSALGKKAQNTAPVKFVNCVWCIPKQILFDNKTDVIIHKQED